MLVALRISNVAVIEEVEVTFGPGLTVLTGETGAGKSILVDALGLLLGGRADADSVRAGCEEASVEGIFQRSALLGARLLELGLPDLGEEVAVRRVVGRGGRGKAYVNGALVTVGVLSRLMRGAVDIAGQHEHVSLFDSGLHRALLDRHGQLEQALADYRLAFESLQSLDAQREALGGDEAQLQARADFLRFQVDELERVNPEPGEELRLENERKRLSCADKLKRQGAEAEQLLAGEESSARARVERARGLLAEAVRSDSKLGAALQSVEGCLAELNETARVLERYVEGLEADPARLMEVDDRLDILKRLLRKHGGSMDLVLKKREGLQAELVTLDQRQERLAQLDGERVSLEAAARGKALHLSKQRSAAATGFAESVREGLASLAMAQAAFEVKVRAAAQLGPGGLDDVEFHFSANPGEPARPLGKVASGGEASRLLLALKRALADSDDGGSYVLDEADAGVSGAVADVVGRMIKEVSAHRQVLCITHLPQVAAHADAHWLIRKGLKGARTVSELVPLAAGAERTQELARMLSGVEVTREALGAAEALMRSAQRAWNAPRRGKREASGPASPRRGLRCLA